MAVVQRVVPGVGRLEVGTGPLGVAPREHRLQDRRPQALALVVGEGAHHVEVPVRLVGVVRHHGRAQDAEALDLIGGERVLAGVARRFGPVGGGAPVLEGRVTPEGRRGVGGQVDDTRVRHHVPGQAGEHERQPAEPDVIVWDQPAHHWVVVEAGGGDPRQPVDVVEGGEAHVGHGRTVAPVGQRTDRWGARLGRVLTSDSRLLTTHAGSLPRPAALAELHGRRSRGEPVDPGELQATIDEATADVIAKQVDAGIDIGNDGEQARESFFTYVQHRMTGFGGTSQRPLMRDLLDHPDYMELALPRFQRIKVSLMSAPAAIGEVTYRDTTELDAECALVADAPFAQTFMTACSPGIVASAMENRHYGSREEYVRAVAEALRTEYRTIVDRGLLLQIDAPDLALERHTLFADRPLPEFLAWVELVIDAINTSLEGIDPASVRLHVCWGNYEGPHTLDVPLEEIQSRLYEAHVGALVISMANARHAHEVRCFERRPLPDHMSLVAGVIDTTSNYVEHPEVVADRLERAVAAVGDPRRVIAGTDCGFDTSAGIGDVAPSLVWEKLRALRDGADLASARLF